MKKFCTSLMLVIAISLPAAGQTARDAIIGAVAHGERTEKDRVRDETSKPAEIIAFFEISPGMRILDLFSGGGYWSELFAHVVGAEGHVVAHTNTAYRNFSGKEADQRFSDHRLQNVEVLESEFNDLALGNASFDMIFIGLAYHDIYFHAPFWAQPGRDYFFSQLYKALKPGGTLAIIDHAAAPGTLAAQAGTLHRIDEEFARADIERAGFRFVKQTDALRNAADDHSIDVFDDTVRHKTDRFVFAFRKP
jgi:predicted methyltransferase